MNADVLIVGAGPNGLMLAAELRLGGIEVAVIDELSAPSQDPKANGLLGQVVRVLDQRGLIEELGGTDEAPVPNSGYFMFGGLGLDLSTLAASPVYNLPVPQCALVDVLERRAGDLGSDIRRGHRLVGLTQDADGVTARVASDNGIDEWRVGYVVGADGAHSSVRELAGIDFPGVYHDRMTVRSVHALLPETAIDSTTGALEVPGFGAVLPFLPCRTERGGFSFAPFPGLPPLITTTEWDQELMVEPMSLEEMASSIARVLGTELHIELPEVEEPRVMRRTKGGNTRVASKFRDGRVFLIGDAAHVFGAAAGGPGLNLGLQDSANLGWKLAGVIRGDADPELLETYEPERRGAAERMVVNAKAQAALIAPGAEVSGLRDLFGELILDLTTISRLADLLSGADVIYAATRPAGAGPSLAGRFCPEGRVNFQGSTKSARIAELARNGRPLLLDATDDAGLERLVGGKSTTFDFVRVSSVELESKEEVAGLLLRPDGYVAWSTANANPERGELEDLGETVRRLLDRDFEFSSHFDWA